MSLSVASQSLPKSVDAISRLIANIALAVRRRMRHMRRETNVAERAVNRGEKEGREKRSCVSVYVCAAASSFFIVILEAVCAYTIIPPPLETLLETLLSKHVEIK